MMRNGNKRELMRIYVASSWRNKYFPNVVAALRNAGPEKQFANDIEAMTSCDACVLLLPCGRSAHTEAGWFAGKGKPVYVLIPERQEPELMYKLFNGICCSLEELVEQLGKK